MKTSVKPFTVRLPQATLDSLHERLTNPRWPDEAEDAGWDYGTNLGYLQELAAYWRDAFDWRAQEAAMNRFAHFRAEVDGFGLHGIHQRGQGPNPLPLLLTHGWPDSFLRMAKIIPLLADPAAHGGDPNDVFDVVVPSIPGFGLSDRPTNKGFTSGSIAALFAKLMTEGLGYDRFGAHGGDVGSGVTEELARDHAGWLAGIHLTDVPYGHLFAVSPDALSKPEQEYLEAGKQWQMQDGAYAMLQGTKPQTLAYGLNDSPVGLAAWIIERFRAWSDCGGDIETRFTKDELLSNITLYWATQTINSSVRHYYEDQHHLRQDANTRIDIPTGVAIFPKDLVPAPREFADRFFNVQRWTEMPRGGHFAALEEPELLVEDIRDFFRPLR